MDAKQLATPDNEADTTISLAISGNRLVSVLNALDMMLYETKRMVPQGEAFGFISDSYAALHETTEAIRDELSRQRCEARKV